MRHFTLLFNKKGIIFYILFVTFFSLYGQETTLIPKDVYVGDVAEIRFKFDWEGNLFAKNAEDRITLVTASTIDKSLEHNYTIKSMQLFPSSNGYILSVFFIPWKTGELEFIAFDLATVFELTVNSLLIDIPTVQIQSILTQTGDTEIKPPVPPVIVPGTTYALIVFAFFSLVILLLIVIVCARITIIRMWVKAFLGKIFVSNNFKKATRSLLTLSKQSEKIEPRVFASTLSGIIRVYLEGRFSHRFTAETTSSFFSIFNEMFAGTASERASLFLEDLYEVCFRCDFLHYAGHEIEKAPLTKDEKYLLIERTKKALVFFEKDTDEDDGASE